MTANHPSHCHPPATNRRGFIYGAAIGLAGGVGLGWQIPKWLQPTAEVAAPLGQAPLDVPGKTWALPGPYRGKVIEVQHSGVLETEQKEGYTRRNEAVVKSMVERGMKKLVGSDDATEAWRSFFSAGDRVGIKIVPVGKPDSISSFEVVRQVIAGLESAGVRRKDILVFDRYLTEFLACPYPDHLPEGVHYEASSVEYDALQVELSGQLASGDRKEKVTGYDRDIYREIPYCHPEHDPQDDRRYRSHLSHIIAHSVDKFISIPVLKDHRSAGITASLKNLSHGSVNNVARSHGSSPDIKPPLLGSNLNQCGTFIPAIVSLPTIREKAVLQIVDGIVATYEGGPGNWNKTFATWPYSSLLFATDPVAVDRVCWKIIDEQRLKEGWPTVSQMGLDGKTGMREVNGKLIHESFHMRQPHHIALAATLGLGEFDLRKIEHHPIKLA